MRGEGEDELPDFFGGEALGEGIAFREAAQVSGI